MSLNNLRGKVPSLEKLVNLSVLRLRGNSLGDDRNDDLGFVSSLGNATSLYALDISQNNFGGIFPTIICNITSLSSLDLQANKIVGIFPICIDNPVNLQIFSIAENQISSVIPRNLGKLQNIRVFLFYSNRLSGYVPSSIGNLTKLSLLYLGENNLVGQIPSSIGNCVNLLRLDTSHNNLNGGIPSEILSLSSLLTLNLSNNHLTGTLSGEAGKLTKLLELDVSSNVLIGEIPPPLSACVELELLNLQDNLFVGDIPNSLKTLISLPLKNLSRNNISGKIPEFLVSLPLKNLNLAYNNFNGQVPLRGVFGNASGISTVGNTMLCGGIPALNLPKCHAENATVKLSDRRKKIIFAVILGLLSVITLVMLLLLCRVLNKKRSRKYANAIVTTNSSSNLSYKSLLKATNGFSSDNLIGNGSFGVVYKGVIDIDETLIAIKVFKLERGGASKSFSAECEVLRNIRYRNLVKVITVCSSTDYQGNDFKALVYEYMVNGSLEDWLHPNRYNQSLNFHVGNWFQRLDYSIFVAASETFCTPSRSVT